MSDLKRKKILWNSDFSALLTGFGRNGKAVLKYLYDTGKYEIIEYACAPYTFNDRKLKKAPWKAYGCIPEDPFIRHSMENGSNESLKVSTRYGGYYIDELIEKERPDCFIGVNDFWAFHDYYDKPWWNKVNCALWITLDSLPIYTDAIQNAHKIKNFWVWSKFAETAMKKEGFDHVKTLHGAFDVSDFYPLSNRLELKKKFGIQDNFIFGFVFRNQGRKLIGTLLEGFKMLKESDPNDTSKLLLHTSWSEGWDIPKFIEEFKINKGDVLTTHICTNCKKYDIRPFEGEQVDCHKCKTQKSVITPTGGMGLSESEMNEVYNIMDFYIHPITSGGLEMPLVESLLAGTPIATVDYSCGEEFCEQEFVTKIPYSTYREMGSQFIKSQPYAVGIAGIMSGVQKADPVILARASQEGRDWALEQFDLKTICKQIEEWIDGCEFVTHDYCVRKGEQNDRYPLNKELESDEEWCMDLIKNVFGYEESPKNDTIKKMVKKLSKGGTRDTLHADAIRAAATYNKSKRTTAASNFFKVDEDTDNVCVVAPSRLEDKIIMSKFFKNLCSKERNVYLVGEESDLDIFSQFGKFTLLPKNEDSNQIEWLKNIKNLKGERRFKKIYIKDISQIIEFENE